jgi:hypothetical protein
MDDLAETIGKYFKNNRSYLTQLAHKSRQLVGSTLVNTDIHFLHNRRQQLTTG